MRVQRGQTWAVLAAYFIVLVNSLGFGQQRPAKEGTHQTPSEVDAFLRKKLSERRITGLQVTVVQQGKIVLSKSYGMANVQDGVPVTNRSIFPINSCTKAFTGVAIMQLVEEGKIDLSAPVSRYLDSLPQAWRPVTIRQLLTHVSGLPDINQLLNPGTYGLEGVGTEEAAFAKIQTFPMDFPTGTQFSYNQTNYLLLGKIIDKFRGKPFAQVFKERQFDVVGMPGTVFGDSRDVIPGMVQSYRYVTRLDGKPLGEEKLITNYAEFPPMRRTASGMNSTAEDMARWIIALQQGKLLKTKEALKTLWTPGSYNNGSPTQWALGWTVKPRPKHDAILITGGGRSAMCVYPEDELAIVVLTNLAGSYPEEFVDELAGFFNPAIPLSDPITALRMQLEKQGFDQASAIFAELKRTNPGFQPTETDLNDWGYRLLNGQGKPKEALAVFKLIVKQYPDSWNAYDSLGEALLKNGRKEEAISMYQKSVTLNPDNQNGKKMLEWIAK
ncbi:serine hydrolase [Spirosoma aerolatum]|uniref:serine hydrolase n=1 Tax=Spirosoma aerolatum TaxID=1211326 RepID=UPI0009AE1952|nr:serine hydrolase [Spirosoma aerolatum]